MKDIVDAHFENLDIDLVEAAIARFYRFHAVNGLRKKPSSSELLDWLSVLVRMGASVEDLANRVPYLGTLIKREQDVELLQNKRRL